MKVNRRQFLRQSARITVGGGAAVAFYSWRVEPHWVELVERDMPLRQLPPELEGKTLLHLSDLHVSRFIDYRYLQHAIAEAAELQPDLVMVTGDLMTSRQFEQVEPTTRLLRKLDPDSRPIFASPGNHEYGAHCAHPEIAQKLGDGLSHIGIKMLRNDYTEYQGLQIIGLDECMAHRFQPADALWKFDVERPGIAMTHNPDSVDLPGWAGFSGWILAGHTHGGQCRIPYFGAPMTPLENTRYTAGEVDLGHGRRLYVNRGLGYTRRVRFLCRPEITLFRLTSAVA